MHKSKANKVSALICHSIHKQIIVSVVLISQRVKKATTSCMVINYPLSSELAKSNCLLED